METTALPPDGVKPSIRRSYESSALAYSRYAEPLVFRFVVEPLLEVVEPFGRPVLDVASGSGALARRLTRCVAIDMAAAQLALNPLIHRVQGDAERLPFRNDSFAVAACAFGINHFPDPVAAVREMARVAPVVGVITWQRPETPYLPKEIVRQAIACHQNGPRPHAGDTIDRMTSAVGSEHALRDLFERSHLGAEVRTTEVEVPWPGAAQFVEYRLSLPPALSRRVRDSVRREAVEMIAALGPDALRWTPQLIVALAQRSPP
ncbi:MAG: methyltransferase domain-containing protein [Actinomycetota bacterium]|nr:methyltransferase domain-containing protein [Actinomycetota bacterium]